MAVAHTPGSPAYQAAELRFLADVETAILLAAALLALHGKTAEALRLIHSRVR